MKTYDVKVEWSGYSRGIATYRVDADSEEEARETWAEGELLESYTVRSDVDDNYVLGVEEVDF